jgi:hypothetical protein
MKFQPLLGSDLSGHLGGIVASHNTYASYLRQRKHPVNKKTAGQQAQRLALQILSAAWRSLDPGVQGAWIAAGLTKKSRSGRVVTLSGQAAWMFVNLLRQRIGLDLIQLPPSSSEPVTFTMPQVLFTAPDQLAIIFEAADEWNAPGGGVIISGSAPLGPGVHYCQAFAAVGSALDPEAVEVDLTYPFTVQGNQTVRLRFHCTGPDGRQTLAVDLDVTLPAIATLVTSVQEVTALTALWVFDHAVTADGQASTALKCDATSPSGTAQAGPNSVLCTYGAGHVEAGKTWGITTLPTHVVADPAIAFPQNGLQV